MLLTYHHRCSLAFIWEQLNKKWSWNLLHVFRDYMFKIATTSPGANEMTNSCVFNWNRLKFPFVQIFILLWTSHISPSWVSYGSSFPISLSTTVVVHTMLLLPFPCLYMQCPAKQLNSSSPAQNGRHFADDIFKCIFVNEKFCILIKISLKFVPKVPIDNNTALV